LLAAVDGRIYFASEHARACLESYFGSAPQEGYLPSPVSKWVAKKRRRPLVRRKRGAHLYARAVPADAEGMLCLLLEEKLIRASSREKARGRGST
jgi:hypothetical protein